MNNEKILDLKNRSVYNDHWMNADMKSDCWICRMNEKRSENYAGQKNTIAIMRRLS